MLDPHNQRRIEIITYDGKGGRLVVPMAIMERVKTLLEGLGARYEVDNTTISKDGGPSYGFISIRRQTDASVIQQALDRTE